MPATYAALRDGSVDRRHDHALAPGFTGHRAKNLARYRSSTIQLQRLDQPLSALELRVGARQALIELGDADLVLADHRASYPLGVLIQPALTFFDVPVDLLHS
jgi:hypothetical protein